MGQEMLKEKKQTSVEEKKKMLCVHVCFVCMCVLHLLKNLKFCQIEEDVAERGQTPTYMII